MDSHEQSRKKFNKPLAHSLKFVLYSLVYACLILLITTDLKAQEISLSISPPITEVMIMPGKSYTQNYILTNNGYENVIAVNLVSFSPDDEFGNPQLRSDISEYPGGVSEWFKIENPQISLGGKFLLPRGSSQNVVITISPPKNAPEGDYYLSLLFETDPESFIGGRSSSAKAKIASNILLTVSKDGIPKKDAQIAEFSAPKLVDSLSPIEFIVRIKNTGSVFFKPQGNIEINPIFGKSETITLAPQNILASSTRRILCLSDEELTKCSYSKRVLFGLYRSKLEFSTDDQGNFQTQSYTLAFPFTVTFALIVLYILLKYIKKATKKTTDN